MYVIIFVVLSVFSLYEVTKKRSELSLVRRNKILLCLFVFCVIFLILFAGTRSELGTDYNAYLRNYENAKFGKIGLSSFEPFFIIFAKISPSFSIFILLFAIIAISIKSSYFYRNVPYVFVALLLYYSRMYLQFDMGIIRQGIALGITFWASTYIHKRQLKNFLLTVLFAACFHYSALFFVLAYPLAQREYSKKMIYTTSAVALVLTFTNFWNIIISLLSFLSQFGFAKYMHYVIDESYRAGSFDVFDLQRILMLVFFTEFIKRKEYDKEANTYLNMYYIGTLLYYLFRTFSAISARGSYYFACYEIVLFPYVLKKVKSPYMRVLIVIGVILYAGIYTYKAVHQYAIADYYNLPYLPYSSWLFE